MEGRDLLATRNFGSVATTFQIAGTGDFDGDGDSDIVWRHQEGHVVTWDMEDGDLAATHSLPQVSTSFQIVGTGDFDGDGDADILWRGSDGFVVSWEMDDVVRNHNFGVVATAWQVGAAGEFDLA
jgi:FG-GAP-like repeat